MSVFTPHASTPASVRNIQRTMIIQVVYVAIFAGLNQSHRGDPRYYQPNEGLVALQALLAAALLGCAYGVGRLARWSLPASFAVEIASLALGIYSLVDSSSGLAAGFILAGLVIYRLAQADVQQALKAGPQPAGQYGGPLPYGAPYGAQPPFGTAPPYGTLPPYGTPPPYGSAQPPHGQPPAIAPAQPATDFYGRPVPPDPPA